MEQKKIEYLVADTAAFIQNKSLQDLAEHVITCQKVIDEVKSKRQLKRLAVLPFDLEIKDVFPENIKFIHEISKQTGDYRTLSVTDIEVIALTYQLEKEHVGEEHLKTKIEMQKSLSFTERATVDIKHVAGFYMPSDNGENEDEVASKLGEMKFEANENSEKSLDGDSSDGHSCDEEDGHSCDEEDGQIQDPKSQNTSNLEENSETIRHIEELSLPGCLPELKECNDNNSDSEDVNPEDILVRVSTNSIDNKKNPENEPEDHDVGSDATSDFDDDEEGWITPENIKQAKIDIDQLDYEDEVAKVACITTDFAMQNVLKQIGLNVASLDGRIIKQIRTYIFRCYACFKTTNDMTKVFCPSCGHNTLKRVSVTLEPDGSQKIHINIKRPLTRRGRKFQLPPFQGGKHSNNPWVTEDQRFPDQKPSRVARTKTNVMENDYIEGYSPFAVRDTTSRAAVLGITKEQKQMRRPNLYRPRVGKKK